MHKQVTLIVLAVLIALVPRGAQAQADAKEAFTSGKALYGQGKFQEARDQFLKASHTDDKNPEVFLWLGKAHYQLGEIDKAMKAWARTLQLAPKEPYATKMLEALKGHAAKPATRIKLARTLIAEGLFTTAMRQCQALIRDEALTDAQRATGLTLYAETLLETDKATEAIAALQEVAVRYPADQNKAVASLLLGRARIMMGGRSVARGLELLKSVVANYGQTPQGAAAQYELIVFGLTQKTDATGAEALKKWITENADNRLARSARSRLIGAYLTLADRTAKPGPDAELGELEVLAITAAGQQIASAVSTAKALAAQKEILDHIEKRYIAAKAYGAAISGIEMLMKAPLPKTGQLAALRRIAGYRTDAAMKELGNLAEKGKLPGGPVPEPLAAAASAWAAVAKQFPSYPVHVDQANLAQRVLALAGQLSWTSKVPQPRQPFVWATQLATPAIRADRKAAETLVKILLRHLDTYYARRGSTAAAIAGTSALLKAPLSQTSRADALALLARLRSELAMKELTDLARAGKLPDAEMPKILADAAAAYSAVMKEFPLRPTWANLAALAKQVGGFASQVPWPRKVTAPKAPHRWAIEIALGVVKADADSKAVADALATISKIESQYVRFTGVPARGIALDIHSRLLAAISPDNSAWPTVMLGQIDLLSAHASRGFADNIKAGLDEANKELTEHQNRMLTAMTKLVARDAGQGVGVLARLTAHLGPWLARGHYELAQQAYDKLADALPDSQKPSVRLAVIRMWVGQANSAHSRLLAAGLTVPRKLDPIHEKALAACYAMQEGRIEKDAVLVQGRAISAQIVAHYKGLEYFDVAELAIGVKAEKAVDAADAHAQIMLAAFHLERARAKLNESLKRYKAKDKIVLTDAFKKAIADYQKFITDRPTHSLVPTAVEGIYGIARIFEQHKAYDVAIGVYRAFAAFAAKSKVLSQGSPSAPSEAEKAQLIVANALYLKAAAGLTKTLADKKPNEPPPGKISQEFAAAIDSYKAFIKDRPDSPLVGSAIGRISKVAMQYVEVGAWDAAEGVFADLLAAGLNLRRPERLEFSRGLCHLGKVMPAHAKEVLKALTAPARSGRGHPDSATAIVLADMDDMRLRKPPSSVPQPPAVRPRPKRAVTGPGLDAAGGGMGGYLATAADDERRPFGQDHGTAASERLRKSDILAMAAIRRQNAGRVSRIAMLRDEGLIYKYASNGKAGKSKAAKKQLQRGKPAIPVLSDAEIARQEKVLTLAYGVFQSIRKKYPQTPTAHQARGEIMVMIGHWRSIARWQKSAALAQRFLTDNPTDIETPTLRLAVARDYLSWAAQPVKTRASTQEMLAEVAQRFTKARSQLTAIVAGLPDEKTIVHQAQWAIADSFLNQARVVNAFSATLARGQYVRAARELLKVAAKFHDHPRIGTIPQMLWSISGELSSRGYHNEAIVVWTDLTNYYPTNSLATQAALRIAQTYQSNLRRPLRAVEAYIELNFSRGGSDTIAQAAVFQIGTQLKTEKRWVEALHVLESFVDSFPRHAQAGYALTMVGQIHQANEAWDDAIAAYKRVISEFSGGGWVREAKWSIAECTINLSRWREAMAAYRDYVKAYASNKKETRIAEANKRIGVLKDLARYQMLVDEKGQRKAFDAQYQIAAIVASQLANPVKAIIEYRKVTTNWPDTHFADDALFKVGTTYLAMGETALARKALLAVGEKYPNSPLADDALYMVGQSYETEAANLGTVTRASAISKQRDVAQKLAYSSFVGGRRQLAMQSKKRIAQYRAGKDEQSAEMEVARGAMQTGQFNVAGAALMAEIAEQQVVVFTAKQLADRQDKINAALRHAVASYRKASEVAAADKADESLLRMATIYADRLKDADAAMKTYLEIVRQFSGTAVAEDASWRIAQYYERQGEADKAIDAYKAFLRNYRRSSRAGAAQFAIAENYEHVGKWVQAMDAYAIYMDNFPKGPMVSKAKEQISWIKTYRL